MKKILFVDDDVALGQIVVLALKSRGYHIEYATSLIGLYSILSDWQPDMLILDVEIGTDDGIKASEQIHSILPGLPILFVSSHVESTEVARGLKAGGVVYLKKPFEMEELIAYINRYAAATVSSPRMLVGGMELRREDNTLLKDGRFVKRLTNFEAKLLRLLIAHRNEIVGREQLERALWNDDESMNSGSLNNYINRLRKCLKCDNSLHLETRYGQGYMLREE